MRIFIINPSIFFIWLVVFFYATLKITPGYTIDHSCSSCPRRELDSIQVHFPRPIRINQAGYKTGDPNKSAFVVLSPNLTDSSFKIIESATGEIQYEGQVQYISSETNPGYSAQGYLNSVTLDYSFELPPHQEQLFRASFGDFQKNGEYKLIIGADTSATFIIAEDIYSKVLETGLKFFGVQRCGATNSWFHGSCHLQDGSALGSQHTGRLAGGWHDCGDHGKYSETLAYSALILSLTYALWPEKVLDLYGKSYNDSLPSQRDGIPDLLAEAGIGAEFIFKLYTLSKESGLLESADMYHSVGMGPGQDHQYWGQPEYQDSLSQNFGGAPRPVTSGIGSNVAGGFAATLAFYSWGIRPYNSDYADSLIMAATDIYDNIVMKKRGSSTIMPCCYPGGGTSYDEEAMAALALWFATKESRFRFDLLEDSTLYANPYAAFNAGEFPSGLLGKRPFHHGGWTSDFETLNAFVMYAMAKLVLINEATALEYGLAADVRDSLWEDAILNLKFGISNGSNGTTKILASNFYSPQLDSLIPVYLNVSPPYNLVFTSIDWGFNRYNLGLVNELFMVWDLTGEETYYQIGMDNLNYILGVNPWDVSFLIGAGDRFLNHIHNRSANPDGFNVIGGTPYPYRKPTGALMGGNKPSAKLNDRWLDYTATETCIDFNAQLMIPAQMLASLPDSSLGIKKFTPPNLALGHYQSGGEIKVYDLKGKLLTQFSFKGESNWKIHVDEFFKGHPGKFPPSLYIARFESETKVLASQLIFVP